MHSLSNDATSWKGPTEWGGVPFSTSTNQAPSVDAVPNITLNIRVPWFSQKLVHWVREYWVGKKPLWWSLFQSQQCLSLDCHHQWRKRSMSKERPKSKFQRSWWLGCTCCLIYSHQQMLKLYKRLQNPGSDSAAQNHTEKGAADGARQDFSLP